MIFNNILFKPKIMIGVLILFISILLIYVVILSWDIDCSNSDSFMIIDKGSSAHSVAQILKDEICLDNEFVFKLALTLTLNNRNIRAGRYKLNGISSVGQLVDMLTSQQKERVKVTLLEGWSIDQYANELYNKLGINKERFIRLCNNKHFVHSLGFSSETLEGFLFPDTYILLESYAEEDIIRVLVNQFKDHLKVIKSISKVNLNDTEIVIMASIIQGEALYEDEMTIISSVYHNRLKKKMLLQADPTIQYIVPGKPRRLYNKDLKIDSPYNTYKYKGLPPGAINNPGLAALKASVTPDQTQYLYFVSNLEGRHTFTKTSKEHNIAKKKMKRKRNKQKLIQ